MPMKRTPRNSTVRVDRCLPGSPSKKRVVRQYVFSIPIMLYYRLFSLLFIAVFLIYGCEEEEEEEAKSSSKDISASSFSVNDNTDLTNDVSCSITGTNIGCTLPTGTSVTALKPTISTSGTSVSPASGVTADFTNPVAYTVTAEDDSTKSYTVTVTVAASDAKAITSFKFLADSNTR